MPTNTNEWQTTHPWEPSPTSYPQPVPLVTAADLFNPMLTIADIMHREAPTCAPDTLVAQAVPILRDANASTLFVVAEDRLVGYLTDRDVALAVPEHPAELVRLTVGELMKTDVPTLPADAPLDVLLNRFADGGVAVIDSERHLQGVVRWVDLLGRLSERALGKLVVHLFQHAHAPGGERGGPDR